MQVRVESSPRALGEAAAREAAHSIRAAIGERGEARVLLSTGQSQFETLACLVQENLPWERVHIFHLDEYVGISADHPASFRGYLRDRVAACRPAQMHYVNPEDEWAMNRLTQNLRTGHPIDVALVGIGENGHIAFNDPPADLETQEPYIRVDLSATCKAQQVHEGWFATADNVPTHAVTMSVAQILKSRRIISAVPHGAKAPAIRNLLTTAAVSAELPATALKAHPGWTLFLDHASSKDVPAEILERLASA